MISDKNEFFELLNEWEASKPIREFNIPNNDQGDFLTQREAARFLGISLPTIISWKRGKKVPYYQQGRTILFKKSELLDTLRKDTE